MIATTLEYPCPNCDGYCAQDVDEDGAPVGSVYVDCAASTACENAYVNGGHADALAAAWAEYIDQDFSEAMNRRYADGGGAAETSSSYIQALRDAGRYR